jgi:Flp pilus assembly protein TadG
MPHQPVKHAAGHGRGQALVELALILPVLVLLAMGTLDLGRAFGAYLSMANAAREGAMYASLHPSDANLAADVTSVVLAELNGAVPATPSVTITPSAVPLPRGSSVRVTVRAPFSLFTTAILGLRSVSLQASSTVVVQ